MKNLTKKEFQDIIKALNLNCSKVRTGNVLISKVTRSCWVNQVEFELEFEYVNYRGIIDAHQITIQTWEEIDGQAIKGLETVLERS